MQDMICDIDMKMAVIYHPFESEVMLMCSYLSTSDHMFRVYMYGS